MTASAKVVTRILKTNNYIVYLLVIVVVTTVTFIGMKRLTIVEKTRTDLEFVYQAIEEDLKNSVLENKGEGCIMPKLDPFDKEIMEREKRLPIGSCEGKDWVECSLDKCYVAKTVREDLKDISCLYRDILYAGNTTQLVRLGRPTQLPGHLVYRLKRSDFVQVTCVGVNRLRPGSQFKWSGYKAGLRRVKQRKRKAHAHRLNVVILCFDVMSRSGFIRRMPESYAVLKNMKAAIFSGYNVVGGGALGALFPIFTGNETSNGRRFSQLLNSENCWFRRLSSMSYRTAFFGDSPGDGSFDESKASKRLPMDHHLFSLLSAVYGRSRTHTKNSCVGDVPFYRLLIDLTDQFNKLKGNRFSFTYFTNFNDNFNMAAEADADLARFLSHFHDGGRLKRTVLVVMGAHGTSSSSIRETSQGKFEERLPLLAILVPDYLKQTRPAAAAAVAANTDVLVTPFDVHTTLTDILGIGEQRNRYTVPGADMERGLTLLKAVPESRSCCEAGVAPHWCACAAWRPLPPRDPLGKEIGDLVVDYINSLTNKLRLYCTLWKLESVEYVLRLMPAKKNGDVEPTVKIGQWVVPRSRYYQTKIVLNPGRAVFEATLRYFSKGDYFAVTEEDISRVNSYANQSTCITIKNYGLNKFCYCRS